MQQIVLGALVLDQAFNAGKQPDKKGKRKVVPGSRPILDKLRRTGLAEIYEDAGFEIGIPGCSYCVGMSADVTGEGEIWLSSQNRNFQNRMGKGSIGHITFAAAVAASSFDMKITNPAIYLEKVDIKRLKQLLSKSESVIGKPKPEIAFVEPAEETVEQKEESPSESNNAKGNADAQVPVNEEIIGKIQRLGDFIDTDALALAPYLAICKNNHEFGTHCLEYTDPNFRERARSGCNVVVAGKTFGCGSSRAEAVMALLGCGIQFVVAESYCFIYSRNSPSLGLMSAVVKDPEFYDVAKDGIDINVKLHEGKISVAGKEFPFALSELERRLMDLGGIAQAFNEHGKSVFEALSAPTKSKVFSHASTKGGAPIGEEKEKAGLQCHIHELVCRES